MAKAADQKSRTWHVVDGTDLVLGRLASKLAKVLQGKHKPQYTPHVDMGDFVVVINADKVKVTGRKADQKEYPYYTGYAGGYKKETYSDLIERAPDRVLEMAVRRMLPKSKLGRSMLKKLKAYGGGEHPHAAQNPKPLDLQKI